MKMDTCYWRTYLLLVFLLILQASHRIRGDLESTYARCCALGANWGRESQDCEQFPAPVPGEPTEHQSICLTAASICCLRFYRETQCQNAKESAKAGLECISKRTEHGGEFYKDCCDGCKLGLISGSMAMSCAFKGFSFGFPWNDAYLECCIHASPPGIAKNFTLGNPLINQAGSNSPDLNTDDENFLFINQANGQENIPDADNLCLLFPGQLCGHVCIPTPKSYVCQCRAGFALSVDGKTCIQDEVKDRCEISNPCDQTCRDTGVSIECNCHPGYELSMDKHSCNDIDECALSVHNCNPSEICINTQGGFNCEVNSDDKSECPAGFKFNAEAGICQDIDECLEELHNCNGLSKTCVNSAGSFRCIERNPACDFGYQFNEDHQTCEDIDECQVGSHLCNSGREKCVNLPGAYRCDRLHSTTSKPQEVTTKAPTESTKPDPPSPLCPDGYIYNALFRSCTDINECERDLCEQISEDCINTQGSYTCQCKTGFTKDEYSGDCVDVNECQLRLHSCEALQRCDNTLGSFTCTRISGCGTGYTLNHNSGKCEDDDECELGRNDCRQLGPKWVCVNTKGSFRCEKKKCPPKQLLNSWGVCINITCTPGFKPLDTTCVDINECFDDVSPCKANEHCFNLIGSFDCRPKINCGRGYRMNEHGTQCIDVDECEENLHTCEGGQKCTNRPGGYVCQCPPGYRFDNNRQCQDINECQTAYATFCGNTGQCENTPGSYRCNCKTGFKKASDDQSCVDVDECTEIEGICEHNCINIWGSHYCTCNAGFKLSNNNRSCSDVDECAEILGKGRLCLGNCVNTPGTFKCSCPDGYTLDSDKRTCKDINECDTIGICRNIDDICVNTRGSHRCQKIDCPPNYVRDASHRNRCKKEKLCREDDVSCFQQPLTYSYNFLPLASNMTLRPQGQVDLFTMRGPLWSSTNVQFDLELESVNAPAYVTPATRTYFLLNRTAFNQVVLTLVRPLQGPQEIYLNLNMKLYHNGYYEGSAVAKLLIFVSKYDF